VVPFTGPDVIFARPSVATWWDSALLTRAAINELRQPEDINGLPAYALEGPRTNFVEQSNAIDTWSTVSVTVDDDTLSNPAGDALSADDVNYPGAGTDRVQTAVAALADSTLHALSAFAIQTGGDWSVGTPPPGLQFLAKDGGAYGTSVGNFSDVAGWQRKASLVLDSLTGATPPQFRIRNNGAEARSGGNWGAQLEEGAFSSSLIETAGAAATRDQDDLVITGGWTALFAQPFRFWIRPSASSAEITASGVDQHLFSKLPGAYMRQDRTGGSTCTYRIRDGANIIVTTGLAHSARDVIRISYWPETKLLIVLNETTGDSVFGQNTDFDAGTGDLTVGNRADDFSPFYGLMTEFYPIPEEPLLDFDEADFSRPSVATWWSPTALELTRHPVDELRMTEPISFRAAALEGPRTNLVQLPHTLDGTDWATFVGIAVDPDQQTSPAGDALSADDLDFAADVSSRVVYTIPTAPTDDIRYAFSAFGRKVSGDWTGTRPQLRARNKAGAQTTAPAFDDSEDWQRRWASYDVSNGANTADIRAVNAEATARTGAYWGFQYELGAFPTSLIESAGADTTRDADDLTYSDIGGNPIFDVGFWFMIRPRFNSAEHVLHGIEQFLYAPQNNRFVRFQSTAGIRVFGDGGSGVSSGTLTWDANQLIIIAVDWVAGTMKLKGFTSGDATLNIAATGDWSGETSIRVGASPLDVGYYHGLITEPFPLETSPI
jgi:hypothetical protein